MRAGERLNDRFVIEEEAGRGGMGAVYRALDTESGAVVAIKTLLPGARAMTERFAEEIATLRGFRHERIVRYVADGATAEGTPWLAMEWLQGEELRGRLTRAGLTLRETIAMARALCDALDHAHARGVVHRDIKPSNVLLVDGDAARPKLLDFGVARRARPAIAPLERRGAVVGTPGYLSPEQARGSADVDARADLFSLGCVLYECLAGRPAFIASHRIALLGKVALAEVTPLSVLRPDLPPLLSTLCAQLLQKAPAARLARASLVSQALDAVETWSDDVPAADRAAPVGALGERELRPVALVLIAPHGAPAPLLARIHTEAKARDGAVCALAGGVTAVRFPAAGSSARDLATRAASFAFALGAAGSARVALALGRGDPSGDAGVGDAFERAAALLDAPGDHGGVRIDDAAAALLSDRFVIERVDGAARGHGARVAANAPAASPCVGRERELSTLLELWRDVTAERAAGASLVIAAPGVGKSRLCSELIARVRAATPDARVFHGACDVMRAGSPHAVLADALRAGLGLEDDTPEARAASLVARVREVMPSQPETASAFLASAMALPPPFPEHAAWAATEASPAARAQGERAAIEAFFVAACAVSPVLLALEDMHWSDAATVKTVDGLLRRGAALPLCILALGRPETDALFPRLWAAHGVARVVLRDLARAPAEQLLRALLGDAPDETTLSVALDRANGNPLFLEEIARAVRASRADALPPSVEAMMAARFDALDAAGRRFLRAASVFGERFTVEGARATLAAPPDAEALRQLLEALVRGDVLSMRTTPRLAGTTECAFKHAPLRDAAYATLLDDDRSAAHRSAARWLEGAGETDAVSLAEHWARGDEPDRAARWLSRAAAAANHRDDLDGASARVDRGLSLARDPALRASLLHQRASFLAARGRVADALGPARAAVDLSERGDASFYVAASTALQIGEALGAFDVFDDVAARVARSTPRSDARAPYLAFLGTAAMIHFTTGQADALERLGDELDAFLADLPALTHEEAAAAMSVRAICAYQRGDLGPAYKHAVDAAETYAAGGYARYALLARVNVSLTLLALGLDADAERIAREVDDDLTRRGRLVPASRLALAIARRRRGALEDALARLDALAAQTARTADQRTHAAVQLHRADALLALARFEEARTAAQTAVRVAEQNRLAHVRVGALTLQAEAVWRIGDAVLAYELAGDAMRLAVEMRRLEFFEARLSLRFLEMTRALMGDGEAHAVAVGVVGRVRRVAARLEDPTARAAFLAIEEHAAMLRIADALGA